MKPIGVMVESLVRSGWRADDDGLVRFLLDHDEGEWNSTIPADLESVVSRMESSRSAGKTCSLIMAWGSSRTGGMFMFAQNGDLVFVPNVNRMARQDFPMLINWEWYFQRILPALIPLGLEGFEISDMP
ncbi:hypothetical protein [Streptomyces zhihengii]